MPTEYARARCHEDVYQGTTLDKHSLKWLANLKLTGRMFIVAARFYAPSQSIAPQRWYVKQMRTCCTLPGSAY